MLTTLILVLALPALQQQAASPGMVWGQVRSEGNGAPLAFAVVELVSPLHTPLVTETDRNGIYVLRGVPPGRRLLRASHIDHAPLEVEVLVPAGKQVTLDFALDMRPVRLPPMTARASILNAGMRDTLGASPGELTTAAVHAMEATPGVAELGLAEAARDIPGRQPSDPTDVLYVRGGAADLKLVLLNGAPVYSPFHIGGLINALDADLIRSATLYLGGAPARYDGGLSYVMDLESRSGRTRAPHASAAVDLLAARAMAEGPVGSRVAYIVGSRGVHGLGATPFVDEPFPYSYGDALGRVDVDVGAGGNVIVTGFWNRESVRLDSLADDDVAAWGNGAASIRYRGPLAGNDAIVTLAVGTFRTRLPLGGFQPLITEGRARRSRIAVDLDRSVHGVRLHYGGSFDRNRFEYSARSYGDGEDGVSLRADGAGDVGGIYVDGAVNATPRLRFRGGLRADVYSLDPTVRLAPRIAATIALTERASLTMAAGKYRQYVRTPDESIVFVGTPIPDEVLSAPLTVASASHLVFELDQELGDDLKLGLEGFYKRFENLPAVTGRRAESSGLDLWVRRETGRFTGWFGYSLAWVWSAERDRWSPTHLFAGRHLVSAGMSGPLVGQGDFDVRVAYGAGLPYTAIPEPENATPVFSTGAGMPPQASIAEAVPSAPTDPDQPYLRLDARIARTFRTEWRGFSFDLTPYVKVLNALDRRDAIFYRYDRSRSAQPHALSAIPVLPIVGLECRF